MTVRQHDDYESVKTENEALAQASGMALERSFWNLPDDRASAPSRRLYSESYFRRRRVRSAGEL